LKEALAYEKRIALNPKLRHKPPMHGKTMHGQKIRLGFSKMDGLKQRESTNGTPPPPPPRPPPQPFAFPIGLLAAKFMGGA